MTLTLNLSADTESALRAQAENRGLSIEAYLEQVLEERMSGSDSPMALSPAEWEQEFEAWADSFPDTPPLSDDAVSREQLYPDRR
jgi:plasmid stability protein